MMPVPSPSAPYLFSPQQYAVPLVVCMPSNTRIIAVSTAALPSGAHSSGAVQMVAVSTNAESAKGPSPWLHPSP